MTPHNVLSDRSTIVVGASRGLGRGIATAVAEAGAPVVAVARTGGACRARRRRRHHPAGGRRRGDATVAGRLLDRYDPEAIVLVAGATPLMRPLQHQTWETFSVNWQADVRIAFHWLREALLKPLRPGSRVIVISSGAARGRVTPQRRVRRRQGHPALHHRVRPGRGEPRRPGHHLHGGAAAAHGKDGSRSAAVRAYAARGGQSEEEYPALRRAAHTRDRRRRRRRARAGGRAHGGLGLHAERRRAAGAVVIV